MAILAFCNRSTNIWQFDTTSTLAPVLRRSGQSNIQSLAPHGSTEFTLVWGAGPTDIRQTEGNTEVQVYEHPSARLRRVRVRNVAGQERIYFSVAEGPAGLQNIKVYYLVGQSPTLYYSVDLEDLHLPHPCTGEDDLLYYTGDFVFGAGDTMYLSTGNLVDVAGIFEVSGAGPDGVTGDVTRIFLGDGPIEGLCYVAPSTLFFLRSGRVFSFDLTTNTEQFEYDITGFNRVYDLVEAPAGSPSIYIVRVFFAVLLWIWQGIYAGLRNLAWGRGWRGPDEAGTAIRREQAGG